MRGYQDNFSRNIKFVMSLYAMLYSFAGFSIGFYFALSGFSIWGFDMLTSCTIAFAGLSIGGLISGCLTGSIIGAAVHTFYSVKSLFSNNDLFNSNEEFTKSLIEHQKKDIRFDKTLLMVDNPPTKQHNFIPGS